ncbi:beta-ketoacyl-[acyl-carrier-protein] synthase family protein [Tahibacter amnicola]|uniref:Beta-ketoacyl-[acyl-carrier-protein] synthase family protein n=1 Tax=Tahibacter amnicola TaxID=2976241 RepID=A0ABY6BMR3_9GAMM|nr:beta-ketoacyl-[acyl-carrier-protein] synthase family protein [Tahibacter amnicola]UXI69102.1 beta-ketoacyl-[acyl-carrier-protein] synthase family protein [Tahibacter amnicola]
MYSETEIEPQEVVVTGVGVVCAGTLGAQALFDRLAGGQTLIRDNAELTSMGFGNPACAFVDEVTWSRVDALIGQVEPEWGGQTRLAMAAATMAWQQAGLGGSVENHGGVFLASNRQLFDEHAIAELAPMLDVHGESIDFDAYLDALVEADRRSIEHHYFHKQQDLATLALARRFGLQEHHGAHGEACAAGAMAIGAAAQQIRSGLIDVALAGATETPCNFMTFVAFNGVGALADGSSVQGAAISRPFDRERYGFVMGEGSAFLVLESAEHARQRGARILARVKGFAGVLEAHRITSSDADGTEYARCIRLALEDAGLTPADIDHVNAHGTSTPTNDACEAMALKQVFGERIGQVPVTANKSALGHSLANSGAVEAVLSVLSLENQLLLPTANYCEPDEACSGLDVVTQPRPMKVRRVLSNSFGFGGANVSLILEAA